MKTKFFTAFCLVLILAACAKTTIEEQQSTLPDGYSLSKVRKATVEEIAQLPYKMDNPDGFFRTLTCQWENLAPTGTCAVDCSDGDHCGVTIFHGTHGSSAGIGCYNADDELIRSDCWL